MTKFPPGIASPIVFQSPVHTSAATDLNSVPGAERCVPAKPRAGIGREPSQRRRMPGIDQTQVQGHSGRPGMILTGSRREVFSPRQVSAS